MNQLNVRYEWCCFPVESNWDITLSYESKFTKLLNVRHRRSMYDKHQIAEEPYNGKLLRTVLKPSGGG